MSKPWELTIYLAPLTDSERKNRAGKVRFTRLPILQLGTSAMHKWTREAHKELWAKRVTEMVRLNGGPPPVPLKRASIRGVRFCTGTQPDRINVWTSFKCLVDALQVPHPEKRAGCKIGASVIEEDDPFTLVAESYISIRVATKAEECVMLTVKDEWGS